MKCYQIMKKIWNRWKGEFVHIKNWNIEEMTGYKPLTTFYQDFSIADKFGIPAIKDTFQRVFKEWKEDYKYFTEFVMVLNWKIFEHYERNDDYARLYDSLWKQADKYAIDNFKDKEAEYYYATTD